MGILYILFTKKAEVEISSKREVHYALKQILKLFKRRIAIFELIH